MLIEVILGVTFSLLQTCKASTPGLQQEWVFPLAPDYSANLTLNKKYTVSWTANLQTWLPAECDLCDPENVDLWVTGADPPYQKATYEIGGESPSELMVACRG